MRRWILILVLLLFVGVGAGQVQENHLIATEEYTITSEVNGEFLDATTDGPIKIQSSQVSGGTVTIEIRANNVQEQTTATLLFQMSGDDRTISMTVFPDSGGEQISGAQELAEKYQQLENQWVQQRIDQKETENGVLTVYEQKDPTKGDIDSETGIPEGSWTQVPVDEDGEPQWLFDTPRGALAYTSTQANTRYGERTWWMVGAGGIVATSLAIQWIVLPLYRRKKMGNFLYG